MPDAFPSPGHIPDRRDRQSPQVGGAPDSPRPAGCVRLAGFGLTSQTEHGTDRSTIVGELAGDTALVLDVETIECADFGLLPPAFGPGTVPADRSQPPSGPPARPR